MKIKHIINIVAVVSLVTIGLLIFKPSQPPHLQHNKAFKVLTGWDNADLRPSLLAFRNSCTFFLKQHPERSVGSKHFSLKAKDWQPACRAAKTVDVSSADTIRGFFQTWFRPVFVSGNPKAQGLFTGYYAPSIAGSRHPSAKYSVPILAVHASHVKSSVIAWVASASDRRTLKMEGSAVIKLDNGKTIPVEYIKGSGNHLYFNETQDHQFHGAQDVTLSPGYSLAVDRQWIPLGTPLWVNTTMRQDFSKQAEPFHRLMIAQDIGSAIRGAIRGDVYWGEGEKATKIGSNVRNTGNYWLLLPKARQS